MICPRRQRLNLQTCNRQTLRGYVEAAIWRPHEAQQLHKARSSLGLSGCLAALPALQVPISWSHSQRSRPTARFSLKPTSTLAGKSCQLVMGWRNTGFKQQTQDRQHWQDAMDNFIWIKGNGELRANLVRVDEMNNWSSVKKSRYIRWPLHASSHHI